MLSCTQLCKHVELYSTTQSTAPPGRTQQPTRRGPCLQPHSPSRRRPSSQQMSSQGLHVATTVPRPCAVQSLLLVGSSQPSRRHSSNSLAAIHCCSRPCCCILLVCCSLLPMLHLKPCCCCCSSSWVCGANSLLWVCSRAPNRLLAAPPLTLQGLLCCCGCLGGCGSCQ